MDKDQIKKYIEDLSDKELRKLVLQFIEDLPRESRTLQDYLVAQVNHKGTNEAEAWVDQSFGVMGSQGNSWNRRMVRDWGHIEDESYTLFERAENAISSGQPETALAIGARWLENFAQNFDEYEIYEYDEEGVGLAQACEDAGALIEKALEHPNVSEGAKKDIVKRINALAKDKNNPFSDYGYLEIKALSVRVNILCMSDDEALKALDEQLKNDNNDTELIKQKYRLLLKMGRTENAESFIEDNLENRQIAEYYVKELFDAQKFEKLIPILKDLIESKHDPIFNPNLKWRETLAKCQDNLGLKEDAIETYRGLFVSTRGTLVYYHILKEKIVPELWPQYLEEMIQETRLSSPGGTDLSNYAEILLQEGRIQDLHDWLKTPKGKSDLSKYLKEIPQDMRADLFPIYRDRILSMAECASKRSEYAYVCNHIANIKALPEGTPIAQEIATILKEKNKRRPAFLDELQMVMGNTKY